MYVLKFGGSSVANSTNIKKVSEIFIKHPAANKLVVVSALGGITDKLLSLGQLAETGNEDYKLIVKEITARHIDCVKELLPVTNQSSCLSRVMQLCNEIEEIADGIFRLQEFSARSKDKLAAYGELLSSIILSGYLSATQVKHDWLDSRDLIKTDSRFGNAQVYFDATKEAITNRISTGSSGLYVAPGFIASNNKNQTTTLGRGGSDYTAAIYASALKADALEIWTDVSGMMTADPRWVNNARPISAISYQEAMELSHFGAKVIYPPTLQPAMNEGIPVWVKNTFAPNDHGTVIQRDVPAGNEFIRGISSINNITLLSLEGSGMVGIPGFSKRLFEALAAKQVNVILITQGSSEHSICVGIHAADTIEAEQAINMAFEYEIDMRKLEPVKVETELSVVALVGDQMKSHPGISGQMFSTLGKNGINIRAIAQGSSEKNITAVVTQKDVKKAVISLHESFFESVKKQLHLLIIGAGNVGKRFIDQLKQQQKFLYEKLGLQVKVVALANSRQITINSDGIDLANWSSTLANGEAHSVEDIASKFIALNLPNSVCVDVTANESVAGLYEALLRKSIAVVACNKIAASSAYDNYTKLKQLASEYNTAFLFETNVGAALPVIGTLADLVKSGDVVKEIDAVLSGTLNFVFNNYDGTKSFATVVQQAQDEGYTEPDPRLDLGGTDVMRKIMILAREAGHQIEMDAIANNSFLPATCMHGSVDDFYAEMARHETHFKSLYDEAVLKGCKLKFVASFKDGKASVGLQHISPEHDFYHLYGKDNIVLFRTQRYTEQPLVIKGAGAGADVTASGVFADVIRIANL